MIEASSNEIRRVIIAKASLMALDLKNKIYMNDNKIAATVNETDAICNRFFCLRTSIFGILCDL